MKRFTPRRILRLARNILFDLKYGAFLGGTVTSPYAHLGSIRSENTDYEALPHIFTDEIRSGDILLDVGCGKGRVINWWLSQYPGHRIFGVEWNESVAVRTKKRLKRFPEVTITAGSILDNFPAEANVIYLFHPFRGDLMRQFKELIIATGGKNTAGQPLRIYYYNPYELSLFSEDERFTIRPLELPDPFFKASVIEFKEQP